MKQFLALFPFLALGGLAASASASGARSEAGTGRVSAPLTVGEARNLPTPELAKRLLGEQLGSKVIEAVRQENDFSEATIPGYVEFYTQPVLTDPRINRICRTDVITIEYDLTGTQVGPVGASTPLTIGHVEAVPRYKSFPMPAGSPGSAENEAAQAAACARMKTAVDAFRAPSAGDAQWLDAIEREYRSGSRGFAFTCDDFADHSCSRARGELSQLRLERAGEVRSVDCLLKRRTGDQLDLCFRLSFPRGGKRCSDRQDLRDFECADVEWVLTVSAGMKTGSSPVRILSLNLEHVPAPFAIS
jgi:hypothetical protein